MPAILDTPDVATFTHEDFERAWQLDASAPQRPPARPEAAIVLRRNSPHDIQDRQIYVFIDDEPVGKIRYGESISHTTAPGEHTVRVFNTLLSQTMTVKVGAGEQVHLTCGNGMPRAGWLLMIFLHVTYLRVWIARDPDERR